MWTFGIPSSLKAWIDHVVRAGKTFNYVGGAVEGLAKGKKAILVLASGGIFSEAALKPLHIKFFLPYKGEGDHPDLWGFGDGKRAFFWIKQGKPDPASVHWGFMAENNGKVDEFYRAAISAGARDNISPRARVEYYPGYYAADVFDPDGYSFEVVHKS